MTVYEYPDKMKPTVIAGLKHISWTSWCRYMDSPVMLSRSTIWGTKAEQPKYTLGAMSDVYYNNGYLYLYAISR